MTPTPVIIVARNCIALTKRAVASVLNQDVPVSLMVVDNCSSDGTAAWLRTKDISTIFTPEQWSLAKCWNVALKAFWAIGHTEALVLNSDVEIRPDTVSMLLAHGGPFVTCVSVDSLDRIGVPGDRDIGTLKDGERPHPDFSAFLIRKSVTDQGIWFNEACYPAYVEDSFLHVRMHRAGITAVCIDLPFYHVGSSTLKGAEQGEAGRIRRGADRNRQMFRKEYGTVPGTPEYEALFA